MLLLISLLAIAFLALALVNYVNQRVERQRLLRLRQGQLRRRMEALEEVMVCLESTLPTPQVSRAINQEILALLREMLALEQDNTEIIAASIALAEERARELTREQRQRIPQYRKESDAKIAQTQTYLNEAAKVVRQQFAQGQLREEELATQLNDLSWASLMVSAASFIDQGAKAGLRGDIFSAHAYYKKAQHLLIGSTHPSPERMRLIRELSELINGQRQQISPELLPEEALDH